MGVGVRVLSPELQGHCTEQLPSSPENRHRGCSLGGSDSASPSVQLLLMALRLLLHVAVLRLGTTQPLVQGLGFREPAVGRWKA